MANNTKVSKDKRAAKEKTGTKSFTVRVSRVKIKTKSIFRIKEKNPVYSLDLDKEIQAVNINKSDINKPKQSYDDDINGNPDAGAGAGGSDIKGVGLRT